MVVLHLVGSPDRPEVVTETHDQKSRVNIINSIVHLDIATPELEVALLEILARHGKPQ